MTSPGGAAEPGAGASPFQRHLKLTLVVVGLVLVPAIVMLVVTWAGTGTPQSVATWASMPAIVTIAAAVAGGRRFAVIVAIVMAFLAPVTIVAGISPVSGAALMAILCLTVGRLSRVGLHRSGLLVPVMLSWALIDPPAWNGATTVDRLDTPYLLWMALTFLVGGLVPALIVPRAMRNRKVPAPQPHTQREAVTYSVMITTLVTVATFYVLDNPKDFGGAFLIAAILVLAPIGTADTLKPTLLRVVATMAGAVLVIALVARVESLALIYAIGLVLLLFAVMGRLGGKTWLYYVLMVPATACLNATTLTQVGELGKQRVMDNLVGGIAVLVASALAIGYSNWASRHGAASDVDHEVVSALAATGGAS